MMYEETAEGYLLRFKNNGRAPEAEIKETGGLKNLRQRVGEIGGIMEVRSSPAFEMILILPK